MNEHTCFAVRMMRRVICCMQMLNTFFIFQRGLVVEFRAMLEGWMI